MPMQKALWMGKKKNMHQIGSPSSFHGLLNTTHWYIKFHLSMSLALLRQQTSKASLRKSLGPLGSSSLHPSFLSNFWVYSYNMNCVITHTCNPSYSGDRSRRMIMSSRPSQAKLARFLFKKKKKKIKGEEHDK
jgi:hypothetical protein